MLKCENSFDTVVVVKCAHPWGETLDAELGNVAGIIYII